MTRQETEVGEGTIVAGYRVQGVLGIGGSGTVYRAVRMADRSLVALKLLNAEHARNEGERQRLAREAEVVRQLAHPHVVALLDYGFADDLPYLVFPLLEGRTLESRIAAEGKVGWGLTGRFSEQALSALEMAHGLSIAHRDIKPANIFCCRMQMGEAIQILDFGTAKIVGPKPEPKQEVTRHGALIGTPRYMAPEQVRGEVLTPAADVYSFGLVMAEMLLGRPLVTGQTDLEIYVSQGSDTPHELPEEIRTSPFASVIERALAKPLDVRYRLASQMLADVRAILARYDQGGASGKLGADLEATRIIGDAPEAVPIPESSMKLRTAFNAIASKASAAVVPPPPASSDETTLPTLMFTAVQSPTPSVAAGAASVLAEDTTETDPPPPTPPSKTEPAPAPPSKTQPEPVSPIKTVPLPASLPKAAEPPPAFVPVEPVVVAEPTKRSSGRGLVVAGAAAAIAAAGVLVFVTTKSSSPAASSKPTSTTEATAASSSDAKAAVVASSAPAVAPPPLSPPGAFTTAPIDRAALVKFLTNNEAKQTPELYELALQGMVGCELPPDAQPTCPGWGDYEATRKRSMAKGGAKKRLKIATKYLQHADPTVRTLAARIHAAAKADEDFDGLLAAAKIEPQPAVLAEMIAAMTRPRADLTAFALEAMKHPDERVRVRAAQALGASAAQPGVVEALTKVLTSDPSARMRAAACAGLAASPASLPIDPVKAAARDAAVEVRTQCFAALTAAWVHTPDPKKEAFDATLAILEEKPRNPAHLPESLGKIPEAQLTFPPEDAVGPTWLKKATFYDPKRFAATLEDLTLDATVGLPLRGAALKALGSLAGKERASSVRKKLADMSDADSKTLSAKPKKNEPKKTP